MARNATSSDLTALGHLPQRGRLCWDAVRGGSGRGGHGQERDLIRPHCARPPSPAGKAVLGRSSRGKRQGRPWPGTRPHPASLRSATFPRGEGCRLGRSARGKRQGRPRRAATSSDLTALGHLPQRGRLCAGPQCGHGNSSPAQQPGNAAAPASSHERSHQGADGICLPNAPFFVRISLSTPFLFAAKYGTINRYAVFPRPLR